MKEIDDFFAKMSERMSSDTLTVGEALMNRYYRLREGKYARRVIIKTCAKIDDKPICFFARNLTWIYEEDIANVLCEPCSPTFFPPKHSIDTSLATWYNDGWDTPSHYED